MWEGLRDDANVACPLCGEEMKPEYGVHARAVGGRCSGCGSTVRNRRGYASPLETEQSRR